MRRVTSLGGALLFCTLIAAPAAQRSFTYPATRQVAQVDVYHGQQVRDPYRWLEDLQSAETLAWVEAQNAFTDQHLATVAARPALQARLRALSSYSRVMGPPGGSAIQAGTATFFRRLEPGDAQPKVYVQHGDAPPELLLDPNTWSVDGATELGQFSPSRDGRYVVYGTRQGGSTWQEYRVLEVAPRRVLPDHLTGIIGFYTAWVGDRGFYYARPKPSPAAQGAAAPREHHTVYYHRLNTRQEDDLLIHDEPEYPKRHFNVRVSGDERTLVLFGSAREGGGLYADVRVRQVGTDSWTWVVKDATTRFDVIDVTGETMLAVTRQGAPKGRVVEIDLRKPGPDAWVTVIPEQNEVMEAVTQAGNRLFVRLLKDVRTRMLVFRSDGTFEREIELPGPGLAFGFGGPPTHRGVYYSFSSLKEPDTIYRYDIESGQSRMFAASRVPGYEPDRLETSQVFYPAKDGTRIPMFLLHRKGLRRDGNNPVLLHGYGAFGASLSPSFDATRLALIEQGFVFAMANIRGGGEYGNKWHEAGRRRKRQTTLDDFIAAAEWLIARKYTKPARLAIYGGSSGGTLVAAVTHQRPDLFGAVIAEAGVMDMFRFQRFTIGAAWVEENGSSDDPGDFAVLAKYSPLHTARQGVRYPPILVIAADQDGVVVPSHSYKYVATLQANADRSNPVLLRVATRSGHADSSAMKTAERLSDAYAFLFKHLGVAYRAPTIPAAAAASSPVSRH